MPTPRKPRRHSEPDFKPNRQLMDRKEIAKHLRITVSRVQQLEESALKKMRNAWMRMHPEDFE